MLPMYVIRYKLRGGEGGRDGRGGREGGTVRIYKWFSLPNIVPLCQRVHVLTSIPIHIASSGSVTDVCFLSVMKERSSTTSPAL